MVVPPLELWRRGAGGDGRGRSALMTRVPLRYGWRREPVGEPVDEEALIVRQAKRRRGQIAARSARVLVAGDLLLMPVPPGAASLVATLEGASVLERFPAAEGGVAALGFSSAHDRPPFALGGRDGRRRGRRRWARLAPANAGRSQAGGSPGRAAAARRPCRGRTPWPGPGIGPASGRSHPSHG